MHQELESIASPDSLDVYLPPEQHSIQAASDKTELETSGLDFLEQLERRHTRVLDELDELNQRIERVIEGYQETRQVRS